MGTLLNTTGAAGAAPFTNLPVPAAPLLGRGKEVEQGVRLLLLPTVRLLTLVGLPGVGKTRLAIEVAQHLLHPRLGDSEPAFRDGVFFVPLAPLRDPQFAIPAIAHATRVRESPGTPLIEDLKDFAQNREFLLVLDNFEHLLPAASAVAALLVACPALKVLATSRSPLRVYGERELPVPPLALPTPRDIQDTDTLSRVPSIALFVERARAISPDFSVARGTAREIADICIRLDGLPLAIELAAARTRLLSPREISDRLERRLDLLVGGARDQPARHQTLRGAIGWSYELLRDGERGLFCRLGIFAGGWTLQAAEAVCDATLERLESLVGEHLVQVTMAADRETRFDMLETIREYALERLLDRSELDEARRRHAAYLVGFAERAEPELRGPSQASWLEQLEAEHENFRAALRWALERAQVDISLRLAGCLARFWEVRGHLSEGQRWLEAALALPGGTAGARSKTLNAAGNVARTRGNHAEARVWYEQSLALKRELGDERGIAIALNNLGVVACDLGDPAAALPLFEESLAHKRRQGDMRGIAMGLNNLGNVARLTGEPTRALNLHEESLALLRDLGDRWGIALALNNLGRVTRDTSDVDRAQAFFRDSLTLFLDLQDRWGQGFALLDLASVALLRGDPSRATRLLGFAETLLEAIGSPLPPAERADRDRTLAEAEARLGSIPFSAARAAGRSMALEDAVAYAMEPPVSLGATVSDDSPSSVPLAEARRQKLTPREREVVTLLVQGFTNRQIGERLVIAERTVDTHVEHILAKLGATSRAQVAAWLGSLQPTPAQG